MKKTSTTLGYIPLIEGKPGRWAEWQTKDGKTEGQICFAGGRSFPLKLEPTRGVVRQQIRRSLDFRRRALNDYCPESRYRIQRVVG